MNNFREYLNTLLQPMRYVTAWCILCLLFAAGTARAQATFEVNGITYKTLTASTVQVGNGMIPTGNEYSTISCYVPATVINPQNRKIYTVTSIGDWAFCNCSRLTSLTFPESLTSIGNFAFAGCKGLTVVEFPASLTSIGESAFTECSRLTSVTFPASLTSIGNQAFVACWDLTSVTFPDSLKSIESFAFAGCKGLTSVTLPDSLTNIENGAFKECSKLANIEYLGSSEPSIGANAFSLGPDSRVLRVPNATGGFTAEKWEASSVVNGGGKSNVDDKTPVNAKSPSAASGGGKWGFFRYLCLLGFVVFFIYGARRWGGVGAGNSKK